MHKGFLKTAAILGALSVAFGAFGAHGLKKVADANTQAIFETAVRYQFYHVFAIIAVAVLYKEFPGRLTLLAGKFFLIGMVLFCGSLYLLTAFRAMGYDSFNWLGGITPFGGVSFIIGWIVLFFSIFKKPIER